MLPNGSRSNVGYPLLPCLPPSPSQVVLDPKKARRRARAALQKALLRAERAKADEGLAACLPLMAALQGPRADVGAAAGAGGAGGGGGSGSEVRTRVRERMWERVVVSPCRHQVRTLQRVQLQGAVPD